MTASDAGPVAAVDAPVAGFRPDVRAGLPIALVSAASFGLSGPLAASLMLAGWSAGAAVTFRVLIAAVVLAAPGLWAVRDDWRVLARRAPTIVAYGVLAVAATQLCYFYAVERMPVGVALMVEYTAPIAVVAWTWLVQHHRPSGLTVAGAAVAVGGLPLLLDLHGAVTAGRPVDVVGVAWALAAMVGAASYFVMSAQPSGLPPITLAASGLLVGAVVLGVAGLIGALPFVTSTAEVPFRGARFNATVEWWVPVVALGLVTAALAYVTGIAATRRLGSRLAAFVALSEVVAAIVFAWLLLGQVPMAVQLVGAGVVGAGVVLVRLGERA